MKLEDFIKNIDFKKVVFVLFCIMLLIISLVLPKVMNYDNEILQKQYQKYKLPATGKSLEQIIDNSTKVGDSFDQFLANVKMMIFAVSFMFCIAFLFLDLEKINIEKVFLMVAIPIGLLYVFLLPIGSVPDEPAHLYRSYEVSLGHILSDKNEENYGGRKLPTILESVVTDDYKGPSNPATLRNVNISYDDWLKNYKEDLEEYDGEEEFIVFSNTALYSFLAYLPQAIGIAISRIFTSSYMVQSYCARAVNFLVYVFIMFYAIKKLPFKRLALVAVAFLPLSFQEAASLSIDGIQMAFTTLLISYTLYLTYDSSKEKLIWKDHVILTVSSIMTAITKFVYLPVCLILFIIPKDKFKNVKAKYIILIAIFMVSAIFDGLIILNSLSYKNALSPDTRMMDQVMYIVKNPGAFIDTLGLTLQRFAIVHTLGLFGQRMCWEDLDIASFYIIALMIVTIRLLYFEKSEKEEVIEDKKLKMQKWITKGFIIIIALGTTFGIILTEYLTITEVGYAFIKGIQSRYYIPLLLLYAIAFNKNLSKKDKFPGIAYLMMFLVFANLNAITHILFRYL